MAAKAPLCLNTEGKAGKEPRTGTETQVLRLNTDSVAHKQMRERVKVLCLFFSCVCLMASMARSVNCHCQKNAVQVHLIGAEPIVQVKR